ncbi:DUF2478 domain-containing protein [Phreatobacter stygius]|uniref:DUF2478 domain-containing protein n=1 Tax=Phreatobacter stygius TaxID=1940610 RepID=A0A4D7B4J3_9HYPH|nr:DUF2478 domain-containing protein [Phreatobacter stygius]QCI68729.1 DUF2478 domain-containing protein [Phreatobacter stygius]
MTEHAGARSDRPKFHGDCDVAAMVYGPGDNPDAVLTGFLRHLLGLGFDALGVVQRRRPDHPGFDGTAEFTLVPDDGWRGDANGAGKSNMAACGTALQGIGARLSLALKRRPDVVILNRYGSLEAAGAGLLDVLAQAIDRDIPVLIAVPEALFPHWLARAEGLAVKLRPDRPSLDAWWHSLGNSPLDATSDAVSGATFCERFK